MTLSALKENAHTVLSAVQLLQGKFTPSFYSVSFSSVSCDDKSSVVA